VVVIVINDGYNRTIAFVIPALGDARSRIRIEALKQEGAQALILGFKRELYNGAPYRDPVISLGILPHGRYFIRLGTYLKALLQIIKHSKQVQFIYVLGLDLALLTWLAMLGRRSAVKLVLEIQDIRSVLLKKGITGAIARQVEKFIVPRVDMLVVTSAAYVDDYYAQRARLRPVRHCVIENKIDDVPVMRQQLNIADSYVKPDAILWIGYFGMLRCRRTLDIILAAAGAAQGRIRFYMRGVLHDTGEYEQRIRSHPYVEYGGEYRSPDELGPMYGRVDMVWACYPDAGGSAGNWLWARTNRFYEACYFRKPIIAAAGTQDGKAVDEHKIGLCIDLHNKTQSLDILLVLNSERLDTWRRNVASLPKRLYVYGAEHRNLLQQLADLPVQASGIKQADCSK
jgi:succinoglycan biosynthesis protein ExoL